MNRKVCVTTYVWGKKYQEYIPIAAYSIKKMYPDYDVIFFLHGAIDPSLKKILLNLNLLDKIIIVENKYSDCPKMNAHKAMALRWVLWDDRFMNYDYLYIIDIDMFYIKEPVPLHEQHIFHMENVTHLSFDNMARVVTRQGYGLKQYLFDIAVYVKNFGVKYLFNFLLSLRKEIRMVSGLHFIDVKKYYSLFTPDKIENYKKKIYDGSYIRNMNTVNNEAFLYLMLKEIGFDVDHLPKQDFSDPYSHTNFNNFNQYLFRPTHGIHLGNYRDSTSESQIKTILNLDSEKYYKNYIKSFLLNDPDFKNFLTVVDDDIKDYFKRYFHYANINQSLI